MICLSIVGHLTIDEIFVGGRRYESMGGVVCYAGLAARALGARVRIFSKIGEDFPRSYLKILETAGIDISHVEAVSPHTTRFQLDYSEDERVVKISSRAGDLDLNPEHHTESDAIYLGPVAWELSLDSIKRLSKGFEKVALDPQGLIRVPDEVGLIRLKRVDLTIPNLWILRISKGEAEMLSGRVNLDQILEELKAFNAKVTILTLGRLGSLIACGSKTFEVPCYETRVEDPTGAGDVFGGAFVVELLKSHDVKWAAAMGSAMASISVEKPSFYALLSAGISEEARRRAEKVYELIEEL
ncbi:MAG: hypothetical protein J7L79_05600 [Thaumarchaeota archaeon]|nr:hypothetical protein [Nitrososphaerota archaeon]